MDYIKIKTSKGNYDMIYPAGVIQNSCINIYDKKFILNKLKLNDDATLYYLDETLPKDIVSLNSIYLANTVFIYKNTFYRFTTEDYLINFLKNSNIELEDFLSNSALYTLDIRFLRIYKEILDNQKRVIPDYISLIKQVFLGSKVIKVNYFYYIRINRINITNSKGIVHTIRGLWIRLNLQLGLLSSGIHGGRDTLTTLELSEGYLHSHLSTIDTFKSIRDSNEAIKVNFFKFCLGENTTPINIAITKFNKNPSEDNFISFLLILKSFVQWESLEGVPFISIEKIKNMGLVDIKSLLRKTILEKAQFLIPKDTDLLNLCEIHKIKKTLSISRDKLEDYLLKLFLSGEDLYNTSIDFGILVYKDIHENYFFINRDKRDKYGVKDAVELTKILNQAPNNYGVNFSILKDLSIRELLPNAINPDVIDFFIRRLKNKYYFFLNSIYGYNTISKKDYELNFIRKSKVKHLL